MAPRKTRDKAQFGDFQTPPECAIAVCQLLKRIGVRPRSILEPTCGLGSFLLASLSVFTDAERTVGLEINQAHLRALRTALGESEYGNRTSVRRADFFATDWTAVLDSLPSPTLVIGNPPWVTNAELGTLGSSNLPKKDNFQRHRGLDAITGKSNFDISEWMLIHLLERLEGRVATLAMLCKTAVARKILVHSWRNDLKLGTFSMYRIDAQKMFGAAVDACLFVAHTSPNGQTRECPVFDSLEASSADTIIGFRDDRLVADVAEYDKLGKLRAYPNRDPFPRWRSGIKHDCSSVMELSREGDTFVNGLGERVSLETTYLYPMLKSSDVAKGVNEPRRWLLVTQETVGQDTSQIRTIAPQTWNYLASHGEYLDRRASSIYRKRPRFSVFGVGEYSFAPWKVAISGFYKELQFRLIGPYEGRPVVLDDTSYFLPFETEESAGLAAELLNSPAARRFLSSMVFWDTKRPITVELLHRLDLASLARELGATRELAQRLGFEGGDLTKQLQMLF